MWRRFWRGKNKRKTGPVYCPPVNLNFEQDAPISVANENCFWKWMFGPFHPFETANVVRQLRQDVLGDPCYLEADKERLIDHCNTFLALFQAIHIEKDESKAAALAPKLNTHVPELMEKCPIKSLRPEL